MLHPVFTFEFVEAFDDRNDGNSVVTEGAVIAGGSSDNVLINPFQNLGEDIRAVLVHDHFSNVG